MSGITNSTNVVYVYNEYKLHLANIAKMRSNGCMIFVSGTVTEYRQSQVLFATSSRVQLQLYNRGEGSRVHCPMDG